LGTPIDEPNRTEQAAKIQDVPEGTFGAASG